MMLFEGDTDNLCHLVTDVNPHETLCGQHTSNNSVAEWPETNTRRVCRFCYMYVDDKRIPPQVVRRT